MTRTGSDGIVRRTSTNAFGYYRFDDVSAGETYVLNAKRKGYNFAPCVVTVQDEIDDADFISLE